jgi:hypothetical protein
VEDTPDEDDIAPFKDGVVLSPLSEVVRTVKYYLLHEEERLRIARRGREVFEVRDAQFDQLTFPPRVTCFCLCRLQSTSFTHIVRGCLEQSRVRAGCTL